MAELGSAGLGLAGFGWAGLGSAGLGLAGLGSAGLGLGWAWLGLAGLGLAWLGWVWLGLGLAGLTLAGLGLAWLGSAWLGWTWLGLAGLGGASGICSPASICNTCGQRCPGVGRPASIWSRCAWQECLESAALSAVAPPVARGLQELAALPAFAADVRGRNVWNLQPCQHLQHVWPESFRSWQPCQHLQQMCVAGMPGICSPVSSCTTCGQRASGVGSPASICRRCARQECLESAALPTVAAHVAREFQELEALQAWAANVRGRNVWDLQPCQQLHHLWPEGFRSWQPC